MYAEVIIFGILASLIYKEITGISPGGIIVPAYFAISLSSPERLAFTFICSVITYFIVNCLSRWVILYGRRTFAFCIVISFLLNTLIQGSGLNVPGFVSYLVPGILASEFQRQGIPSTSLSLMLVSAIIAMIAMLSGIRII